MYEKDLPGQLFTQLERIASDDETIEALTRE